ncbi:MAG: CBS domain-containing protein [Bryobacterales bacterium]|nr:CBS domain-containing protein [Bryobacterales bacterium]
MCRIKDLLQGRELFYVETHETVAGVARKMAERKVGATLVLEGGELRGVFSERDLMTRVVVAGVDPASTRVGAVMSTDVKTIEETEYHSAAMTLMQSHNCRHLPVTRSGRVVGFISMRDLMNYELARKTEELNHMQAYIHGAS